MLSDSTTCQIKTILLIQRLASDRHQDVGQVTISREWLPQVNSGSTYNNIFSELY